MVTPTSVWGVVTPTSVWGVVTPTFVGCGCSYFCGGVISPTSVRYRFNIQ